MNVINALFIKDDNFDKDTITRNIFEKPGFKLVRCITKR